MHFNAVLNPMDASLIVLFYSDNVALEPFSQLLQVMLILTVLISEESQTVVHLFLPITCSLRRRRDL